GRGGRENFSRSPSSAGILVEINPAHVAGLGKREPRKSQNLVAVAICLSQGAARSASGDRSELRNGFCVSRTGKSVSRVTFSVSREGPDPLARRFYPLHRRWK